MTGNDKAQYNGQGYEGSVSLTLEMKFAGMRGLSRRP